MNPAYTNVTDFEDGTSPGEVFSATFFVPVSSLLVSLFSANTSIKYASLIEVFSSNAVLLLALTILSSHLLPFFLALFVPLVIQLLYIYIHVAENPVKQIKKYIFSAQHLQDFNRKFIGDYRGHLLLATAISILGVDFAFFPLRFSKTQTYGWSIMDAGVGSFVFVHGLCSSTARRPYESLHNFKKCMMSSIPLFLLGFIRLAATTYVGYHKVVSEYGVHWNFFFTLALTKVICFFISEGFPHVGPACAAVLTITLHQFLLSYFLTDFIMSDARNTIIEANKEGICSLLGFVSIYFFGVFIGGFLWRERDSIIDYFHTFLFLSGLGLCGWLTMYLVCVHIQPVSRKMANLAYCIWVVSLTSLQIALHLLHQMINFVLGRIIKTDLSRSLLWAAINYNGLFYFLLANVLTGLVNLSIKTENCNYFWSFVIMVMYLIVLNLPTVLFYKTSIQLKFW